MPDSNTDDALGSLISDALVAQETLRDSQITVADAWSLCSKLHQQAWAIVTRDHLTPPSHLPYTSKPGVGGLIGVLLDDTRRDIVALQRYLEKILEWASSIRQRNGIDRILFKGDTPSTHEDLFQWCQHKRRKIRVDMQNGVLFVPSRSGHTHYQLILIDLAGFVLDLGGITVGKELLEASEKLTENGHASATSVIAQIANVEVWCNEQIGDRAEIDLNTSEPTPSNGIDVHGKPGRPTEKLRDTVLGKLIDNGSFKTQLEAAEWWNCEIDKSADASSIVRSMQRRRATQRDKT
jgi:hypothetical protein